MDVFDPLVIPFNSAVSSQDIPDHFPNPFQEVPHPLAVRAAQELQKTLHTQPWDHDFGLTSNREEQGKGKMFGILVVKERHVAFGYLAAFSGKLNNGNSYPGFVPPVCNGQLPGGFLDLGMQTIDDYNHAINALGTASIHAKKRAALIQARRAHSNSLQDKIYDGYRFLNQAGLSKSLRELFKETHHTNPPGGAGDCAAPKVLHYAFQHQLTPLAMAEFWWGHSADAPQWRHCQYYAPCKHKCQPILQHMLAGLVSFDN